MATKKAATKKRAPAQSASIPSYAQDAITMLESLEPTVRTMHKTLAKRVPVSLKNLAQLIRSEASFLKKHARFLESPTTQASVKRTTKQTKARSKHATAAPSAA